jgi:hypothetical protein
MASTCASTSAHDAVITVACCTAVLQAASATKQEALQQRLVQQFCRRRQQLRLGSCLLAWRCQQQYQQQQSQQLHMLALILQAWHLLVHTLR